MNRLAAMHAKRAIRKATVTALILCVLLLIPARSGAQDNFDF